MSHTEFGRRSQGFTREGLRNLQGVHFERTDDGEIHEAAARLRRTAFWIGAGALLIGIYVGTKSSGRDLNFWRKDPGPAAAQPYVPVRVRDVTLERINSTCTARGDSAGRGNVVRQAAAYVICLSTETPRRLCQATHRTHFLAATTNYYRLLSRTPEARPDPQVAGALRAVVMTGVVPRRDVVAAGNADLEAFMRNVEPARSGC